MQLSCVEEKFRRSLASHSMLEGKSSVLLGLSGGADSSLLLTLLTSLEGLTVYAAHVNHMIRGAEADSDEEFCRRLCKELGIVLFTVREDIPSLAKKLGKGLEETARDFRYQYFDALVREHGIDCIATAHNASDNAETLLFNLIRGCGADGLCGIPPVRGNIIRPLILCTKEEIIAECNSKGIPFVTDSTNIDTDYTRNFIRHKLIPTAKEINPALERSLINTSELLRRDKAHFEAQTAKYSLSSGRDILRSLDDAVLSRILIRELKNAGVSPESKHIEALSRAIRSNKPHFSLSLPKGTVTIDRNGIYVGEKEQKNDWQTTLTEGVNTLPCGSVIVFERENGSFSKDINTLKNIYKLSIHITLDSAKIDDTLVIEPVISRDRYRYGGMTRSVKKLLQAKKMPISERKRLPKVMLGGEIIWIPGFPAADSVRPTVAENTCTLTYFYHG